MTSGRSEASRRSNVSNGVVLLPDSDVDHRVSGARPLIMAPMLWELSTHPDQSRRRR